MKIFIKTLMILLVVIVFACGQEKETNKNLAINEPIASKVSKEMQDSIVSKTLERAYKYELYSQDFQAEIDKGLAKDSTIAYLWQQKAMPMFKQGKHELGLKYIDKAVKYNSENWQDYRAFMKCIFVKDYSSAIIDFKNCKEKFGNSYVMDHTYNFYIGLSYLQLNEFKKAEDIFRKDYENQLNDRGESQLHHLDLFYYGISRYEQKNYMGAIEMFDKALNIYPNFSDVQCYKGESLRKLGKIKEGNALTKKCQENAELGNTINEDNVRYERYPYQIRWRN